MEYMQTQPSLAKLCLKMVLIFLCIGMVLAFVAAYSMYGEWGLKSKIMGMAIWLDYWFTIMVNPANTYEVVDGDMWWSGKDCARINIVLMRDMGMEHFHGFDGFWDRDDKCIFVTSPFGVWVWNNLLTSA